MPSYVITGVSKGLGWEFLNQLSSDPNNTVVGIVRDPPPTLDRVAKELGGRSNITILHADLLKYEDTKRVAAEAAKVTGGVVDYLIANAGYVPTWDAYDGIGVLGEKPDELNAEFYKVININVLANIHLYNLFMPYILKSKIKKVAVITSAQGDMDWAKDFDINVAALYATSKAAMNMITAKFSAQFKREGVLFLSICPGMVDVGHFKHATEEQMEGLSGMLSRFSAYAPDFKGPDQPPEAITAVMSVIHNASLEKGDGGAFLSHFGNKQWI